MMSIEVIRAMNSEATREAVKECLQPFVAMIDGDRNVRKCPVLAHFIPKGWKIVKTYFVDNSGFGSEDETALTMQQFMKEVKLGFGYGIYEQEQFQVYIREYKRTLNC